MTRPKEYLAILDVGHGNSAVVLTKNGVLVVDTGSGSALLEFLTEQGIKIIDVVVMSHADQDHIGAMAQVLASKLFTIHKVFLNTDSAKGSQVWDDLLYELQNAANAGSLLFKTSLTVGENGQMDIPGLSLQILAPSQYLAAKGPGSVDRQKRKISSNTISAVIRVVKDSKPVVVLPGDLDAVGLDHLIASGSCAESPILVFPHHGGLTGALNLIQFVKRFLKLVSPRTIVFSIGRGGHGNPDPVIVGEIRRLSPRTRLMCTQLSESCATTPPSVPVTHLNAVFSQGHQKRYCCAGTILVDVSNPSLVLPRQSHHRTFIKESAPTPLCLVNRTCPRK